MVSGFQFFAPKGFNSKLDPPKQEDLNLDEPNLRLGVYRGIFGGHFRLLHIANERKTVVYEDIFRNEVYTCPVAFWIETKHDKEVGIIRRFEFVEE